MAQQLRPPVVTILGHVDHGKTTLLDYIRKTNVASKEHGGITQAIGAYQIGDLKTHHSSRITFIDTPGHAAFEKMRARGAALADIAVLVVAVDDGVMPQTVEAIKHVQAAGIPMVVAVNKIDLAGIDTKVQLEKIKKQLSDQKALIEEYGGDVPLVQISAKSGQGIDNLLETISLVTQVNELKGDPQAKAVGIVIESHLDKFKGAVATVLVRDGTLKKGDQLGGKGRVRGMFDFAGKNLDSAGPSTPVEVLGFETVPAVGSVVGQQGETVQGPRFPPEASLEGGGKVLSLVDKLRQEVEDNKTLSVVVKADKQGSLEAIETALERFNEKGQKIKIVSSSTGEVTESDVELASATRSIVLGFNVSIRPTAKRIAETQHVLVRTYNVIYELLKELEEVAEGMLHQGILEEVFGRAQIVAEFPYGKAERIAGCRVLDGTISKGPRVRVVREDTVVGEGKLKSIKRLKEEMAKVEVGQECGFMFDPVIDFQIGDIVESFRTL